MERTTATSAPKYIDLRKLDFLSEKKKISERSRFVDKIAM